MVGVLLAATVGSVYGQDQKPDSPELSLVHDGAALQLEPSSSTQLAAKALAYFETCHTHESVVGNQPEQSGLRQRWEDARREPHALVRLPPASDGPTDLLIGFSSGSGAWPVVSRQNDRYILYTKCDGLAGLLLACDVSQVLPDSAPPDCDRLREMKQQESPDE